MFVAQLPNFTYYALAFLFVSSAVNGLCATVDSALPGAPMCYSMQSFLNEQTTFAFSDICAEGSLAGCRKTASENFIIALAIILIASLFVSHWLLSMWNWWVTWMHQKKHLNRQ